MIGRSDGTRLRQTIGRVAAKLPFAVVALAAVALLVQNRALRRDVEFLKLARSSASQRRDGVTGRALGLRQLVLQWPDGRETSLAQLFGEGVRYLWLLDPGCGVCRREVPIAAAACESASFRRLVVAASTAEALVTRQFLAENGLPLRFCTVRSRGGGAVRVPRWVKIGPKGEEVGTYESAAEAVGAIMGDGTTPW
jgi:hypothetical protein